jgi:hypothetical protein
VDGDFFCPGHGFGEHLGRLGVYDVVVGSLDDVREMFVDRSLKSLPAGLLVVIYDGNEVWACRRAC